MSICLDYASIIGGWHDKEGNLHWGTHSTIAPLKFPNINSSTPVSEFVCTECSQRIGSKTMLWNGHDEEGRGLGFRHERCD